MEFLRRQMFQGRLVIIAPLNVERSVFDAVDESAGKNEVILIIIDN
jgi:hypothetical protein